jgi:Bacterial Ig-like domain (group 3)
MSLKCFRNRYTQRTVSMLTGIALAGSLLLSACGDGGDDATPAAKQNAAQSAIGLPASGKAPTFKLAQVPGAQTANSIHITATSTPGTSTVQLQLPADADSKSLAVTLNGKDVSGRFTAGSCSEGACVSATLTARDGYAVKNVLNANIRGKNGSMASGRVRFAQMSVPPDVSPATASIASARTVATISNPAANSATPKALATSSAVCDPTTMCPPWLPPSVSFVTNQPGGWNSNNGAWITVNGQGFPSVAAPTSCAGAHYAAVVLDRQTLTEKTGEPESSPQCFIQASDLKNYLATLTPSDLVIAGTVWLQSAADDLDTTPAGGSSYANAPNPPQGYMLVGAGAQAAGSAYENLYDNGSGDPAFNVFATGTLQEDASGNYNFQSSDIVEYAISPNDPSYLTTANTSAVAMNIPTDMAISGETRRVYSLNKSINGLWLLILDRLTLLPVDASNCTPGTPQNGTLYYSCSNSYPVAGDTPAPNRDTNWNNLATALSNVNDYQLVFLVSSGAVGTNDLPTTFQSGQNYSGFSNFAAALTNLGGTTALIAGPTFGTTDTYSLVGFPGAKNELAGGAAEASSMLQAQGQYGVLHGTLQRNLNGRFQPGQTSQEPQPVFQAKGGLDGGDFLMMTASFQQPVDWPSNSSTTLLPSASTIAGQQAAYRFISHWLLAGYYVKGISGPHQDDLHYFFSGSSNTWIDYHTQDAADLPFPGGTSGWNSFACDTSTTTFCTFTAPGDSAPSGFSSADFAAVQKQISLEVLYLTNTLQFLVTGSTNMKDVIASGNANVGLALTSAAATILGSNFVNKNQALASAQVNFSWQSLLGMLGGIASTIANAEGVGELLFPEQWANFGKASSNAQKAIKNGVGIANTIGALLATIGSGGTLTNNTAAQLPNPYTKFTTTIGQLANGELQSPLIVGFDVLADNLTSDWARLSRIGPRVVNVSDPVYYAPNQVSQNTALQALTNASAQTFYFSLLPTLYHIDQWSGVKYNTGHINPTTQFQPAMGSLQGHLSPTCNAYYLNPNQSGSHPNALSPYQGVGYPVAGTPNYEFGQDEGLFQVLVIAGTSTNPKSSNTYIPSIDANLATILFASDQLNTSMQQFVGTNGPMPVRDASKSNPSGYGNDDTCDMWDWPQDGSQAPTASSPDKDVNGNILTTTTLTSSRRDTLDSQTILTATVDAAGKPLAAGFVYFVVDGQLVGKAAVGTDGTATLTIPQIALGNHTVEADYSSPDGYAVSSSTPTTVGVYAGAADLTVTAASPTLEVSYDKTSQPLPVTITSVAGMSGDVQLSCSGLPIGMSCQFNTPTPTLTADGNVQSTVVIGPTVATQAALGLLLLPMLIIGWRREDGSVRRRVVPAILAVCIAGAMLTGCGSDNASTPRETGNKTVLITATVGGVSRSATVDVHID